MPRVGRAKIRRHASAVTVNKPEAVIEAEAEAAVPVPSPKVPAAIVDEKVKPKKQLKLPPQPSDLISGKAPHPYFIPSKSHLRRQKRKVRDIAGGLGSLGTALDSVFPEDILQAVEKREGESAKPKVKTKEEREEERRLALERERERGKIGQGKSRTLGEKKRRQVIQESAKRIPAVMQHPSYQQNPWATIREHAGNTLAQKTSSSKNL